MKAIRRTYANRPLEVSGGFSRCPDSLRLINACLLFPCSSWLAYLELEVHGRSRSSTPGPKMASVDANDLPSAVDAVKVIDLASFMSA